MPRSRYSGQGSKIRHWSSKELTVPLSSYPPITFACPWSCLYEPGGKSIVHSHLHSEHVLYILEGQLTVVDGARREATAMAGEALYVPAGEVHMAENRGTVKTRYIAVTAPPPE